LHPEIGFDPRVCSSRKFLVVDSDPLTFELCSSVAENIGYVARRAVDLESALEILSLNIMSAVVADMSVPVLGGDGLLRILQTRFLPMPLVCISSLPTLEEARTVITSGAAEYLAKPLSRKNLHDRLVKVFKPNLSNFLDNESLVETRQPFSGTRPKEPVVTLVKQSVSVPKPFVTVDEAERSAILKVLRRTGGNKLQAAKYLGIGRTTLYRKLKLYEQIRRRDSKNRLNRITGGR
jgi:DNA-binding NtrC family response regulator